MKLSQSQIKAQQAIWSSVEPIRGRLQIQEFMSLVLFLLIWAKYIPQSKKDVIGYFDILEELDDDKKLNLVINALKKEVEFEVDYLLGRQESRKLIIELLGTLRTSLMPAATLLAKGTQLDTEKIIDFLQEYSQTNSGKSSIGIKGINKAILDFSNKLFDDEFIEAIDINCLYSIGTSSAYSFANKRNVYFYEPLISLNHFTKGIISLYGKPLRFNDRYSDQEIAFAAPPFGLKSDLDIQTYAPFEEDEESKLISDLHCKLLYLAHKKTKKTTIAITNLGTLFSKSKGINYFREKIIDQNWVDSIITLPSGIFPNTGISSALIVLKKDRSKNEKIQLIDFSDCKKDDKSKRGVIQIANDEINSLFKVYKNKKATKNSILISREQIKENDYDLNFNKYIISNEDQSILETLKNRKVVSLDSLVNFVRPLAISRDIDGPELNEVMISDINAIGELTKTNKKTPVSETFLAKAKSTFIKKGDLIISIKGTLGKIGMVRGDLTTAIPGPSLCVLRVHDSALVDAEYLFQYLRSDVGQRMITKSSQGAVISFLSIQDLKNLQIPIPEIAEQKKAAKIKKRSQELFNSIDEMQKELNQLIEKGWLKIEDKSSKTSQGGK